MTSDDGALLFLDTGKSQGSPAYLGRPLARAGEPNEYLSSGMLQRVATQDGLLQR